MYLVAVLMAFSRKCRHEYVLHDEHNYMIDTYLRAWEEGARES